MLLDKLNIEEVEALHEVLAIYLSNRRAGTPCVLDPVSDLVARHADLIAETFGTGVSVQRRFKGEDGAEVVSRIEVSTAVDARTARADAAIFSRR